MASFATKPQGRTSSGKVFIVPETKGMLQTLFNPTAPKSTLDYLTLTCIAVQLSLFFLLPWPTFKTVVFLLLFVIFRTAYNLGLGLLLKWQSKEYFMVNMAQKYGLFGTTELTNPELAVSSTVRNWVRVQLESKMGSDYNYDEVPIEFNTWLVFRQLVDIVLLNDFFAHMLFSFSAMRPLFYSGESPWFVILCTTVGVCLLLFNIWVKLDAHRVVKDFAWYWGDFFFLVKQNLIFDGVFKMAPHPMYSIGYAGYYGASLISRSFLVFFVSLLAHAAQFAFLSLVESPHIDKTYGAVTRPPYFRTKLAKSKVKLFSN